MQQNEQHPANKELPQGGEPKPVPEPIKDIPPEEADEFEDDSGEEAEEKPEDEGDAEGGDGEEEDTTSELEAETFTQRTEGRQQVTLWLADEVLEYFRNQDVDWKDRIDYTLKMYVDMGGIWYGKAPDEAA